MGRGRTLVDLTGRRFGMLEVVEQAEWYTQPGEDGRRKAMWLCRCACGKDTTVRGEHLTGGYIISCGCATINEVPRPLSVRFSRSKSGAKARDLPFELTMEEFDAITSLPCEYCGEDNDAHRGVDRVDSSLGYVAGNCVPCCWLCNRFKGSDLSPAQLAEHARRIYMKSIK